jgi:hypothetical protein
LLVILIENNLLVDSAYHTCLLLLLRLGLFRLKHLALEARVLKDNLRGQAVGLEVERLAALRKTLVPGYIKMDTLKAVYPVSSLFHIYSERRRY